MSPLGGSPAWSSSLSLPGIRQSNTNIARPVIITRYMNDIPRQVETLIVV